jgi:hypothetical protein
VVAQGPIDQQALGGHAHPALAQQLGQFGHPNEASLIRAACLRLRAPYFE